MLRESALRLIADRVNQRFLADLYQHDGSSPHEVRGRIVLCLTGRLGLEERIRKTAKYAQAQDATFTTVTVRTRRPSETDKRPSAPMPPSPTS
ncbi:MAG: hypothetical protein ACREN8_09075 [Candidatus Dormibacteraceae bacterium]